MSDDWYSKTTWTEADQADFFARLKRSRMAHNKANYLWVQARELDKVGLSHEAMMLLDKVLTEFPEPYWLPLVCKLKAEIFIKLGNLDQAIAFYRRALDVERQHPNHRTQVVYDFGKLVVENKMTPLYDEALAVLNEMEVPGKKFPVQIYKKNGILAIMAAHKGQGENAGKFAQIALDAVAKDDSGFRYHPKFGLVQDQESKFYNAVEAIAISHIQSFSN
jgi:tetratricopeptide (TPR) repeat protein